VRSEHQHEDGQGTLKRSRTMRGCSGGESERGGRGGSSEGSGSTENGPPGDGPGGRVGGQTNHKRIPHSAIS
jgi:hypothetical protein